MITDYDKRIKSQGIGTMASMLVVITEKRRLDQIKG